MSNSYNNNIEAKRFKKSLLALSIMTLMSVNVVAQENEKEQVKEAEEEVETIAVKGMRVSLWGAQQIKRNATEVIDSITADDLGNFPDKSIAEALQRVPGITVTRFSDPDRTFEFSAEPSGVIIRGMPQVLSQFNGRDSFSATSSRGLSWGDVSPELMAGVDVYKSQSAELTEGGISGVVNLRTRVPFDNPGESFSFSVGDNYNETSGDNSPELSGIYSNRWEITGGEFGMMLNLAYSDVNSSSQGQGRYGYVLYNDIYPDSEGNVEGSKYLPTGVYLNETEFSRVRKGTALALQWRDDEDKFLATLQYNRSGYENSGSTKGATAMVGNWISWPPAVHEGNGPENIGRVPLPLPETGNFEFDQNGAFLMGTVNQQRDFWTHGIDPTMAQQRRQNGLGEAMILSDGCSWGGCPEGMKYVANEFGTNSGFSNNQELIEDLSFNLKWRATDRLSVNFDAQYVDATLESYRMTGSLGTLADTAIDLSGEEFKITLADSANINLVDGGAGVFATKGNYALTAMDAGQEDNEGNEFASKIDFTYDVGNGYIEAIKAGVRYADREQVVNRAGSWGGSIRVG